MSSLIFILHVLQESLQGSGGRPAYEEQLFIPAVFFDGSGGGVSGWTDGMSFRGIDEGRGGEEGGRAGSRLRSDSSSDRSSDSSTCPGLISPVSESESVGEA